MRRVVRQRLVCVGLGVLFSAVLAVPLHAEGLLPEAMIRAIEKSAFEGDDVAFDAQKTALEQVGTPEAFFRLGQMYEKLPTKEIVRIPKPDIAAGYYQKAIDAGDVKNIRDDNWLKAHTALAILYRDGRGVDVDTSKAIALFQDAMQAGHAGSAYSYAVMLEKGYDGHPADVKAAVAAYLKALALESGEAGLALARIYRSGVLGKEKAGGAANDMTARALVLLRADADKGNGMSAWLGGHVYEEGLGVNKDSKEALSWYEKGAKVNAPSALLSAARLLAQGVAGKTGERKIVDYMRRAATAGSISAAMEIGEALFQGEDYYAHVPKDEALLWLKRAAGSGNTKATNRLAEWYMIQDDVASAMPFLQKTAERGSFSSLYTLYRVYREGMLGVPDYEKAKQAFQAALALKGTKAEDKVKLARVMLMPKEPVFDKDRGRAILEELAGKGHIGAMNLLAHSFESGVFGQKDFALTLKWLGVAADKGDVMAMLALADAYHEGVLTKIDEPKARAYFDKALASVKPTDYTLMARIGRMYKMGGFEGKDKTQALKWFEKAAEGNDPLALFELGRLISWGQVDKYQTTDAIRFLKAAARGGNQDALLEIGKCYAGGRGVPVDHVEAVKYFMRAADLGLLEAMRQLGIAFIRGRGVVKDTEKGLAWLRKASENGLDQADMDLGIYYAYGMENGAKDMEKAVVYFKKAAEEDIVDAQYMYGSALLHGQGVTKNVVEGKKWLQKAVEGSNKMAAEELHALEIHAGAVVTAVPVGEDVDDEEENADTIEDRVSVGTLKIQSKQSPK